MTHILCGESRLQGYWGDVARSWGEHCGSCDEQACKRAFRSAQVASFHPHHANVAAAERATDAAHKAHEETPCTQ